MEEVKYKCPECKDTGMIWTRDAKGYDYVRKCKCLEIKEAKERLERSGLAREFKEKRFDNYNTYGNEKLEVAKSKCESYVKHTIDNDGKLPSLLLCGQVGAGKTHLGTASSVALINAGMSVKYMCYREEMTSLKAKVMDEVAYTCEINRLKQARVLFIDDFLKGKITESDINIIYEIVNYRYNNDLPIIISTEKDLDGLINFDEAIGSRIIEMCKGFIVVFRGKELNHRLYKGGVA